MHSVLNTMLRGLRHVCSVAAVMAHIHKQFWGLFHGAHTVLACCKAAWCNPSPSEKKMLSKAAQRLDWILILPQQLLLLPYYIYLQICASGESEALQRLDWHSMSSCKLPVLFFTIALIHTFHRGSQTPEHCCSSGFIDCLSALPDGFLDGRMHLN